MVIKKYSNITTCLECRFWNKINKNGKLPNKEVTNLYGNIENCWECTKSNKRNGRCAFSVNNKIISAHRLSWELHYGVIPANKIICHKCDNPICITSINTIYFVVISYFMQILFFS